MTGRLIPPRDPEFTALFDAFRSGAFQLETLQVYAAAGEDEDVAAFLAGRPLPSSPVRDGWLDMVRRNTTAGRTMRRVHVLTEPLTEYATYEVCWPYALCTDAGEDIRLIVVPEGAPYPHLPNDLWLFDSRWLYRQHHDSQGRWLGTEPVEDPDQVAEACRVRDELWSRAVPWRDYIAERPALASRMPLTA